MSIETIIIIILALLVLVIVAASFSGGMSALWKKIIGVSESTTQMNLQDATTKCGTYCTNTPVFCSTSFIVDGIPRRCQDIATCTPAVDCTKA